VSPGSVTFTCEISVALNPIFLMWHAGRWFRQLLPPGLIMPTASCMVYLKHRLNVSSGCKLVASAKKREHIKPVLCALHLRIDFKILLMTLKSLNGLAPRYIHNLIVRHVPGRQLRSADHGLVQNDMDQDPFDRWPLDCWMHCQSRSGKRRMWGHSSFSWRLISSICILTHTSRIEH